MQDQISSHVRLCERVYSLFFTSFIIIVQRMNFLCIAYAMHYNYWDQSTTRQKIQQSDCSKVIKLKNLKAREIKRRRKEEKFLISSHKILPDCYHS